MSSDGEDGGTKEWTFKDLEINGGGKGYDRRGQEGGKDDRGDGEEELGN